MIVDTQITPRQPTLGEDNRVWYESLFRMEKSTLEGFGLFYVILVLGVGCWVLVVGVGVVNHHH
jgi:hypothetical protein